MPSRYKCVHMHIQFWEQKHLYKYKCNNLCRNTYTQSVAATGFFAGEVEIFDFVTERVKRCIAAKRMNLECAKKFGSIFYGHSVFNFSQFIHAVICEDILMRKSYNVYLFLNVITHNRVCVHITCVAMWCDATDGVCVFL